MEENLLNIITVNPEVCHGKPVIRNMRYTVKFISDLLSAGMTYEEIINDYPSITNEDIAACIKYSSLNSSHLI